MYVLRNEKGQSIIEFALVLPVYLLFIFALIVTSLWGAASFCAQEVAHESARKYAVTLEDDRAIDLGERYLHKYAYLFVEPDNTQVDVWIEGEAAVSEVIVVPRIQRLFSLSMPEIRRTSRATLEDVYRNPDRYMAGKGWRI